MATYSPADFDGSPFDYGQRVRIHLYSREGFLLGTILGTLAAREPKVNVARDPEGPPQFKTLYWVKDIEGYDRPHEDLPDTTEPVEEGWFAEQDIEPVDERLPPHITFN
ncbi:MAG: hypothetical protein AAFX41_09790 [Bacteroidota bacterium]